MKYSLIIQDLDADEARDIIDLLENENTEHAAKAIASGVAAGGDVDSTGLRWDKRIHASTKAKNKDGSFKRRKGVDDAVVASVEAELRAQPAVNTVPAGYAPTPAGVTSPGGIYGDIPNHMAAAPAPQQPAPAAMPVAAPVAAPQPAPAIPVAITRDAEGLMKQLSKLFASAAIDPTYPNTICARINQGFNITTVSTLNDILNNPQMVEYAWQCLDVDGKAA